MLGNGSLRWLLGSGLLAGLAALVACAAPPPEKTPLVVCEAGQNGCPKEKKNKPGDDDGDDDSETSESSLTKGQDDDKKPSGTTPTASAKDAGTDSSSATLAGPNCRALEKCCDALDDARITGSGAQCRRTVEARNEASCRTAHQEYKTPDDYYDPVCF